MNNELNESPLYEQLCAVLIDLMGREGYEEGKRFLTEREICRRFEVSRPTANKALTKLIDRGILILKKGIGTFVASHSTDVLVQLEELYPFFQVHPLAALQDQSNPYEQILIGVNGEKLPLVIEKRLKDGGSDGLLNLIIRSVPLDSFEATVLEMEEGAPSFQMIYSYGDKPFLIRVFRYDHFEFKVDPFLGGIIPLYK